MTHLILVRKLKKSVKYDENDVIVLIDERFSAVIEDIWKAAFTCIIRHCMQEAFNLFGLSSARGEG